MFQIQEELLKDGFRKKSEEMNAEINHLKNMIETTQNDTPWVGKIIDRIGSELTSILLAPAKLVGGIVRGISSLLKKK